MERGTDLSNVNLQEISTGKFDEACIPISEHDTGTEEIMPRHDSSRLPLVFPALRYKLGFEDRLQ
jgi:hypothetical protein